jgi:glycosyltransferase involved in cell wall biosynthesis
MASAEPIESGPPLRIAHVITRLLNGGADENTVLSCNHAAREGHEVILVHGADTHAEIVAKVDPAVRTVALPSLVQPVVPGSDLRALGDLRRLFARLRPYVVHTHTSKAGILGRIAARATATPVIVHGVHIVPFWNVGEREALAYRNLERAAAGVTDAFVDVSSGMRDLCLEAGIGSPAQHHLIHSGFDLERFRGARPPEDWRELLGLGPDEERPPVLVMVAAFEARKRHAELLAQLPKIVERSPEVRLVLVGDGKLRAEVEAQVEAAGLGRNVIFAGFRPDPERLIALADLCVLASMREGLPRVLMQYLAAGRPVAAADLPGLHDVVVEGVNGTIAPADDLGALGDAIAALLADDERRERLAAGAAATDLSDWDAGRMGDRIEAVYREVIATKYRESLAGPEPRRALAGAASRGAVLAAGLAARAGSLAGRA